MTELFKFELKENNEPMETTNINSIRVYVSDEQKELIEKSKNQYSANIIALSKFNKASDEANDKALDKALIKHSTKQSESTVQSTDTIDKPIYNITNIQFSQHLHKVVIIDIWDIRM